MNDHSVFMPRKKREDTAVKIAAAIVRKARVIAAYRNITIAEYLSALLEKPVERDYRAFFKELRDEDEAR